MKTSIVTYIRLALATVMALCCFGSWAHSVNDLQMRVVINAQGHARVVEVRECVMGSNGTEGFIKQYNLHGMGVGELSVSDERGVQYEVDTPWDVDRTRAEKANRCGIAKGSDGPELCWGIGASGPRTYNIRYTLTNLVNSFSDSDGFNFKFYEPASGAFAQHARIEIEPEEGAFTPENTRVWAFRFHGTVEIVDGKIVAETSEPFAHEDEGLVILAQFNKGLFHPVTSRKGTFLDKLKKPAFKGSDYQLTETENDGRVSLAGDGYNPDDEGSFLADLWEGISALLQMVLWLAIPFIFLVEFFSVGSDVSRARQNMRLFGNKAGEQTQWSREIPLEGNLYRTSEVLHAINSSDVTPKDQIAAVVMRMTHQHRIHLRTRSDGTGNQVLEYVVPPPLKDQAAYGDHEAELMELLHEQMWKAAGDDHVLQPREMEEYMKRYPVEHRSVVRRISGLMSVSDRSIKSLTPQEVNQVYGLRKFLKEFTLLDERGVKEVGLWKEYMVFATLFGIAKQVYKDLKKIWPEYAALAPQEALLLESDFCPTVAAYTLGGMRYVEHYETPAEREARLAREREERRSSGGGGSSSYHGGGGHSGGGGSGFR